MPHDFLRLGSRITLLPIVHGSGDFAIAVRQALLNEPCDCLAVPLPPSFQPAVEEAIGQLPAISAVVQLEPLAFDGEWDPDAESGNEDEPADRAVNYVPIDPCQGVIAALRMAMSERIPRAFIDLETACFEPRTAHCPDPYALKRLSIAQFAAALLPVIPRPVERQHRERIAAMAANLRQLEQRFKSIVFVCPVLDFPWIRDAYLGGASVPAGDDIDSDESRIYAADEKTLIFLLGELPFITGLYEQARVDLDDDENLSIDGVKQLLLESRSRYRTELKSLAREITPHLLATYLRYARNLSLIHRRMTPDLYTLVVAAQQIAGDQFAIHLAETAREYPYIRKLPYAPMTFGIKQGRLPDGVVVHLKSRLPVPPVNWCSCRLNPRPQRRDQRKWGMRWNPYQQCSWPPEDVAIENFRTHVKDRALSIIGNDLARSEKFSTSLKDGLDIRETLRNWHTGDLYVKVIPPTRGKLDCAVMLFDSPADPREYPWRTTWMAEHAEESTLAFYATDFHANMVGPGIGLATYGGAMFLFPPRPVHNIWDDPQLDFATTLEERLIGAACLHSREKHIALLSAAPPGPGWRRLAKHFRKRLVHVPLGRFSQATVQQLRLVHVLNGKQIRSYAADFIRKG